MRFGKHRANSSPHGRGTGAWTRPAVPIWRLVNEDTSAWLSPKPSWLNAPAHRVPCNTVLTALYTHGKNSPMAKSPSPALRHRASWYWLRKCAL